MADTITQDGYPQAVTKNLVVQDFNDETLIYNLETHKAVCLNSTASFVWSNCNGQNSVAKISELLARKINQPANEEIIWLALNLIEKEGLIVKDNKITFHFNGMSRREAVRRVGLATMITLPMISSLVAPTAVSAQSAGSADGACTSDCNAVGGGCNCQGGIQCSPGFTVGANIGAGVCADVSAAVNAGINVAAGVNGNVCLFADACVTVP